MTDRDLRALSRNSRARDVPNRNILRTFVTTRTNETTTNVSQVVDAMQARWHILILLASVSDELLLSSIDSIILIQL